MVGKAYSPGQISQGKGLSISKFTDPGLLSIRRQGSPVLVAPKECWSKDLAALIYDLTSSKSNDTRNVDSRSISNYHKLQRYFLALPLLCYGIPSPKSNSFASKSMNKRVQVEKEILWPRSIPRQKSSPATRK